MELDFTNYNQYRDHHNNLSYGKKQGRGVLIVLNNKINCELLHVPVVFGIIIIIIKILYFLITLSRRRGQSACDG